MREQKAITLVALVITIIVLIILVGVTIAAVINSGIIGQTKQVAEDYQDQEILEQVQMAVWESMMKDGQINLEKLKSSLEKMEGVHVGEIDNLPTEITTERGLTMTIASSGKVEKVEKKVQTHIMGTFNIPIAGVTGHANCTVRFFKMEDYLENGIHANVVKEIAVGDDGKFDYIPEEAGNYVMYAYKMGHLSYYIENIVIQPTAKESKYEFPRIDFISGDIVQKGDSFDVTDDTDMEYFAKFNNDETVTEDMLIEDGDSNKVINKFDIIDFTFDGKINGKDSLLMTTHQGITAGKMDNLTHNNRVALTDYE